MAETKTPVKLDKKLVAEARTFAAKVSELEVVRTRRDNAIATLLQSGGSVSAIATAVGLDSQLVRRVKTLRQI